MLDAEALINKHQGKGILLDTNLLVLFFVGLVNRQRISKFKRTRNFTLADFDLLEIILRRFSRLIAVPHVLTQVSDLTDLEGEELRAVRRLFKKVVEPLEEFCDPSRQLVNEPIFESLGLADAAVGAVCSRGILVLTDDLRLQLALQRSGADALNFNHVRQLAWRV